MKACVSFLLLFILFTKSYSQAGNQIRETDSLVKLISTRQNLALKAINDTAYLTYPNGDPIMYHYYTLKCFYEKNNPEQLVKAKKERTTYYYYRNELVKVEDRTEKLVTFYFENGQLFFCNAPGKSADLLSKLHQAYGRKFLEKFLAKS